MRLHRNAQLGIVVLTACAVALVATTSSSGRTPTIEMSAESVANADSDPSWLTVAASGSVESRHAGLSADTWQRVRRGDDVAAESAVRTAPRGRATLTRHGDVILVSPDSELILPAGGDATETVVRQNTGTALYQVSPRSSGRFRVETPYLVAGVKGTEFSVVVDGETILIDVVTGHVLLENLTTGATLELFAGQTALQEGADGSLRLHREGAREIDIDREALKKVRKVRQETRRMQRIASFDAMTTDGTRDDIWTETAGDDVRREKLLLKLREYQSSINEEKLQITDEEPTRKTYIEDLRPSQD